MVTTKVSSKHSDHVAKAMRIVVNNIYKHVGVECCKYIHISGRDNDGWSGCCGVFISSTPHEHGKFLEALIPEYDNNNVEIVIANPFFDIKKYTRKQLQACVDNNELTNGRYVYRRDVMDILRTEPGRNDIISALFETDSDEYERRIAYSFDNVGDDKKVANTISCIFKVTKGKVTILDTIEE